ncbi:hypothetical protein MGWOODY_Smn3174 [hydrothermal vent metagenome]|uniref:Uncharacterized protein n=1 Tax=hydrothermal vent metagenome TaxID=652676 RepID=A0A170PPR0_9ZZZZ
MPYDVAFRFSQALDPSVLSTLPACLHALTAAIEDCRNAGKPRDSDPAVLLLARHLGAVAQGIGPADMQLRRACIDAIAELKRHPALIALAYKGVAYDPPAKTLFHADGRKAMRRLGDALGLAPDSYHVRSHHGGVAVSGDVVLHGAEVQVRLSLGCMGPGQEVMYRRIAGRHDHVGERNHWASVHELVQPERLAVRICRDLRLSAPSVKPARLFA